MSDVPRPIRLVYYDEGRFHMDTEAVSILLRVKGPIGVVSVCGPVQHGKSFLSNQLLKRTSGFQVAPTVPGRCTKGLWLWSSPSRKTAADGTECNMLVMDTEGINGTILLSSCSLIKHVNIHRDGSLEERFKKGMGDLRSFVFVKTKPKKIGETVMTGPIFVQITQYILDAFNSGKRPTIACIRENVEKPRHQKALTSVPTAATLRVDPPAANTRQRKRSIEQRI